RLWEVPVPDPFRIEQTGQHEMYECLPLLGREARESLVGPSIMNELVKPKRGALVSGHRFDDRLGAQGAGCFEQMAALPCSRRVSDVESRFEIAYVEISDSIECADWIKHISSWITIQRASKPHASKSLVVMPM